MNLLPPVVITGMTWAIPSVALVTWLLSARRERGTIAGLAVVAFGVAAALAQAAEGHLALLQLTTFGGTAAVVVMTVRRRVGAVLGVTALATGVASAHGLTDVVGAVGGALVAAVAVGVAIPLWGWLSPRPLRLDDLDGDAVSIDGLVFPDLGIGGPRSAAPSESSVTESVGR